MCFEKIDASQKYAVAWFAEKTAQYKRNTAWDADSFTALCSWWGSAKSHQGDQSSFPDLKYAITSSPPSSWFIFVSSLSIILVSDLLNLFRQFPLLWLSPVLFVFRPPIILTKSSSPNVELPYFSLLLFLELKSSGTPFLFPFFQQLKIFPVLKQGPTNWLSLECSPHASPFTVYLLITGLNPFVVIQVA